VHIGGPGERLPPRTGFVRAIQDPDAWHLVTVYYFPPYYAGNVAEWPRIAIGLQLPPRRGPAYAVSPYFYELLSEDVAGRRWETLVLTLDREITVAFPQQTTQLENHDFEIALPPMPTFPPGVTLNPLQVEIRRVQVLAQVPQSAFDEFYADGRPRLWSEPVGTDLSEPGGIDWHAVLTKSPTKRGTDFNFFLLGNPGFTAAGTLDLESARPDFTRWLATLEVISWNLRWPGAYAYRVSNERRIRDGGDLPTAPLALDVALSARNVGARLRRFVDMREFLRYFELRLTEKTPLARVPRQGDRFRLPTYRCDDPRIAIRGFFEERFVELPEAAARRAETLLLVELGLGFTPVVGDVLDIGHFVSAILTGRDLLDRPVETWEFWVMAVALMPEVPSALRRLGGSALRRAPIELEDVVQIARRVRPRLAAALLDDGVSGVMRASRVRSPALKCGHVWDEELLEILAARE
jgi:hypothetical protein